MWKPGRKLAHRLLQVIRCTLYGGLALILFLDTKFASSTRQNCTQRDTITKLPSPNPAYGLPISRQATKARAQNRIVLTVYTTEYASLFRVPLVFRPRRWSSVLVCSAAEWELSYLMCTIKLPSLTFVYRASPTSHIRQQATLSIPQPTNNNIVGGRRAIPSLQLELLWVQLCDTARFCEMWYHLETERVFGWTQDTFLPPTGNG